MKERARRQRRWLLVVCLLGVAGCGRSGAGHSTPPPVASIGGEPISQALLDYYIGQKTGAAADKVLPARKAELLVELKSLIAAGQAGATNESADTAQEIELSRLTIRAHAAAKVAGVFDFPSDAALQAAYRDFVASQPVSEYHVAHILVSNEATAMVLITRLQAGEDFSKLAATQSADDSKSKGGDLGWISLEKLPDAFTDAVKRLKAGQMTVKPVHTAYGWHVIELLGIRATAAPPFDQVKAQLAANLQQARYQHFLRDSFKSAQSH